MSTRTFAVKYDILVHRPIYGH